jgi:hypothetical protein
MGPPHEPSCQDPRTLAEGRGEDARQDRSRADLRWNAHEVYADGRSIFAEPDEQGRGKRSKVCVPDEGRFERWSPS